jgi:hypothetical protein
MTEHRNENTEHGAAVRNNVVTLFWKIKDILAPRKN